MKKLLVLLLVLLVVVAGVGFFASPDYAIEKRVTIQAPVEVVHSYVGDLEKWPEWTPWMEHDPTVETTYGDKTTGVGAHQSWTSEDGDGELTFTKWDPKEGIAYDMAFIMEGERYPAKSAMTYKPVGDGATEVTWTMQGSWEGVVPPVMDGLMKLASPWMIGGDFDAGLAKLKEKAEAAG